MGNVRRGGEAGGCELLSLMLVPLLLLVLLLQIQRGLHALPLRTSVDHGGAGAIPAWGGGMEMWVVPPPRMRPPHAPP